jgi:PAS domain S-box-containing protein
MSNTSIEPSLVRRPGVSDNFRYLAYPDNLLVWMSDTQGQCSFVSPSWSTFTGRERAQELGNGWLDHVHPDDREHVTQGLHDVHADQVPFRRPFRYLREDGVYRWLMGQNMPHPTKRVRRRWSTPYKTCFRCSSKPG